MGIKNIQFTVCGSLFAAHRSQFTVRFFLTLFCLLAGGTALAQTEAVVEAMATVGDGEHSPLWLNANKYGLSSVEKNNGYLRGAVCRHMDADSAKRWAWQAGLDMALASHFTSTVVVHQAYGELRWLKGLLTVGSKEQPMALKNQELSSGSQTLGINARPVPSVRLSLPEYWDVPLTNGWLGLKGHIAYGMQTDDVWQKDFTHKKNSYTEHARLHTKAGYLRIGKKGKPFSAELGIEMGCQYGGTSYVKNQSGEATIKNTSGLKGMLKAFVPSGGEYFEKGGNYENAEGNHVGSYVMRVNMDYPDWDVSLYADHFFEDHSSMFLLDYDGYGTGDQWDVKEDSRYFRYDLRDCLVGMELRLKHCRWISDLLVEYIYTKYQSGPVYHDHTRHLSDHISGRDNYYNHHIFLGWQHWGQVMGNPLYRSPLYNNDNSITVNDNRFWAWHIGLAGNPLLRTHYRLLCTWQRGWGTYYLPFLEPERNVSLLAEASHSFSSNLEGWSVKAAVGMDRGGLLGDNFGVQFTVGRKLLIKK